MRVVFDTNIFVSALLSKRGAPNQLFQFWEQSKFELLVSQASIEELERVLYYSNLHARLNSSDEELSAFVNVFRERALWVIPQEQITVVEDDLSDNLYLEIAVAGSAQYVVSGDKHLLRIREYRGIQIVPPAEFLALLIPLEPDESADE
jgi:uncharacterized protein